MNTIFKFSVLLGAASLLVSCSNYGYISENDVYMQAPTEVNLDENEDDITSFNAFKARNKGAFDQEYKDPRMNERVRANQILIINSYNPYFGSNYMFGNGPIGFHGMGSYSNYFYSGFNSGLGFNYGYGNSPFYYNQMDPFGYGFGYGYGHNACYNGLYYGMGFGNNYYAHNYYGNGYYGNGYYGNGYYGNGYYNGGNQSNSTHKQPTYYGNRNALSSTSSRSSYNPSKSMMSINSEQSTVNNETLGDSRRDVQRRTAGGNDYSDKFNKNGVPLKNRTDISSSPTHRRMVNTTYTPSSSARRAVSVQQPRQSGVSSQPSRSVSTTRSSGVVNSQSTRSSTPRTQSVSPRQGSVSSSPSSGGSSRGSSSSSSSRRR